MFTWRRRDRKHIYELGSSYSDSYNFPSCWIRNIEDVDLRWDAGEPIDRPLPGTIEYEVDRDLPLEDLAALSGGPLLASPRLWSLIKESSSCGRAYRSEVFFKGERKYTDFVTVNFERSFECLDHRRSRFSEGRYKPGGYNGFLKKAVVREESLPPREQIFRLGESPVHVLVTEKFKSAVEEEGLSGLEVADWRVVTS